MGMNISTKANDEPEVMMDINTTPIDNDVMLVLLIMLIITIPVELHSVNLDMPTGKTPGQNLLNLKLSKLKFRCQWDSFLEPASSARP